MRKINPLVYFPVVDGKKLQLSWAKQQKINVALFVFEGVQRDWQVPEAVANCLTGFVNGPGKVI